MDDLISRKAFLRHVENQHRQWGNDYDAEQILGDLEDFPSAQQWIPCSERMPDQNGKYLVVGRQKAINILKFDGGRWYGKWGVVAWMPLPSRYKGEEE